MGPLLTRWTSIIDPNTPVSTCAPDARNAAQNASTSGSDTGRGAARRPRGSPSLAGVGVEGELADHEYRRADVGGRALVVQHA